MDQAQSNSRRQLRARPSGEALEQRSLLTGGAGSIFALVQGNVPAPGNVASHTFTLDADHFQARGRSATLGIDIAASGGSTIQPRISSVATAGGKTLPITYPRGGVLSAKSTGSKPGVTNGAVLAPVEIPKEAGRAVTLSTHVMGESNTTGNFILGYFLPGDANGDGTVARSDVQAIQKAIGSLVGDSNYSLDADANRDGRVGLNDVNIARRNIGLSTTVTPVVSANLDPISDSGVPDRITVYQDVIISGQGTPGATITYSDANHKADDVKATLDKDGNYTVTLHLAEGKNSYQVTYVDGFGQVISGKIADLTYQKPLVPVASPTKPTTTTPTPTTPTPSQNPPKVVQLMSRFPTFFAKHPDQAARLREMLARRGNT